MSTLLLAFLLAASPQDSFSLSINGKTFHNNDTVPKADLGKIATLEIYTPDGIKHKPIAFETVIGMDNNTWKATYNVAAKDEYSKLEDEATLQSRMNFDFGNGLDKADIHSHIYITNVRCTPPCNQIPMVIYLFTR